MPWVDPEFEVPGIPEEERYEGTEVDENVLKGKKNNMFYSSVKGRAPAHECLLQVLPPGTKVIWAATHGASFWAISTKIETELADGTAQAYFMKVRYDFSCPRGTLPLHLRHLAHGVSRARSTSHRKAKPKRSASIYQHKPCTP